MNITQFKSMKLTSRSSVNFIRIPVNIFGFNDTDVTTFNNIVKYWESQYENWNTIVRTPSGGISKKHSKLHLPAWDFVVEKSFIELTVLTVDCCARYQVSVNASSVEAVGKKIGGSQAYRTFLGVCSRHGVDLTALAIPNGPQVKETIEKPMIKCMNTKFLFKTWKNVHHIDLNSSYMSGIAQAFPVLEPVIKEIYAKRKDPDKNAEYKAVLNCSYGFFQSKYCRIGGHGYSLSHLSKAARDFNDAYILKLIEKLEATDHVVLMVNTDGIWYTGSVYHDADEGTELGQWKNDHVNCTFRMKTHGAYEYIENGNYCPVVRGSTRLDEIMDRKDWKWGDIFKYDVAVVNAYKFDKTTHQIIKSEVLQ